MADMFHPYLNRLSTELEDISQSGDADNRNNGDLSTSMHSYESSRRIVIGGFFPYLRQGSNSGTYGHSKSKGID